MRDSPFDALSYDPSNWDYALTGRGGGRHTHSRKAQGLSFVSFRLSSITFSKMMVLVTKSKNGNLVQHEHISFLWSCLFFCLFFIFAPQKSIYFSLVHIISFSPLLTTPLPGLLKLLLRFSPIKFYSFL